MSNRKIVHEELGISSKDIEEEYDQETLLKWKAKIDEDIQIMSIDIETAKSKARNSNEYSDPEWFHKVRVKKKYFGILSQKIQNQLGIARKRRRKKFENVFVDICARELEQQTFEELKALTDAELRYDERENRQDDYL
jgi:hypothetical protein